MSTQPAKVGQPTISMGLSDGFVCHSLDDQSSQSNVTAKAQRAGSESRYSSSFRDEHSTTSPPLAVGASSIHARTGMKNFASHDQTPEERLERRIAQRTGPASFPDQATMEDSVSHFASLQNGVTDIMRPTEDNPPSHFDQNPGSTVALLATPTTNQPTRYFRHDPHFWCIDAHEYDHAALKKMNKGSWMDCCFPDPQRCQGKPCEVRAYHSPFGGQNDAGEIYQIHESTRMDLMFQIEPDLTPTQFCNKYKDKPLKLSIPPSAIREHISAVCEADIDWINSDYQIIPFDIHVKYEVHNFPITFDKLLITDQPSQHDGSKTTPQSWSSSKGPSNRSSGLMGNNKQFNPIIPGVCGVPFDSLIYKAPDIVNGAEFTRYINRPWKLIEDRLNTPGNTVGKDVLKFILPPETQSQGFTFDVFFLFENMDAIVRDTPPDAVPVLSMQSPMMKDSNLQFNKVYSMDGTADVRWVYIYKPAYEKALNKKKQYISQKDLLMNVKNPIVLLLNPVGNSNGWDNFMQIAKQESQSLSNASKRVHYTCVISIHFAPFMHTNSRVHGHEISKQTRHLLTAGEDDD